MDDAVGVMTQADDGLSDPMTYRPVPMYGAVSSGSHLLRIAIPPGQLSVTLPTRSLSVSLSQTSYSFGGSAGMGLSYSIQQDNREVTLHRDGARTEIITPDGVTHGDSRFSYTQDSVFGEKVIDNSPVFHPTFLGNWPFQPIDITTGGPLYIGRQWSPQPKVAYTTIVPTDTWNTHQQVADFGSVNMDTQSHWFGDPDAVKHISISYRATDLYDSTHPTASATYDLALHDQFDNWRRVDTAGNPVTSNTPGTPGSVILLASADTIVPAGAVTVSIPPTGVNWSLAGINGGAFVAGAGAIASVVGKTPTWVGLVLSLAGLTAQTVGSQPTDPALVNSPDQMNVGFMQSAYQNDVYNLTALPGQQNNSDLVDTNFYKLLGNNPDFQGFHSGLYGQVSVTTTVSLKTLNYYFYGNEYDNGGLVRTTAPGSVLNVPDGYLWTYQWHCAAPPIKPGANPLPAANFINPMPSS